MIAAHETRMRQGQPSATAQGAAEGRAAHQLLDRPLIFEDHLAVRILGSDGEAKLRAELADHQTPLMRALRGQFVGRCRYAEDALAAAIGLGTRQYVVLGAGLDTFAYRSADRGVKVFEVDHPATQAWKRDRLSDVRIEVPATLTFAPMDFETQGLGNALANAGFDAQAPAFVSCLGVCNYLQKEAFYQTLGWAASLAAGSEIVLDFMPEPSQQSAQMRAAMGQIAAKVMAHGEPLRSFYEPVELAAEALDLGFRQADVVTAAQVNAQYFEPAGSELRMRGYLMHARMQSQHKLWDDRMNAPLLSSLKINLPTGSGKLETFILSEPRAYPDKASATFNRVAFSAAHVVADARAANDPWIDCAVDWDQTLRYREYLWDLNLGVAEAMDTAQRGMGLDWPTSLELITRTVKAGKAWEARNGRPAQIASGCGTDHLDPASVRSVDEIIRGYEEQMAAIEKAGGRLIVMASRALARVAKSPADYEKVYDRVLSQAKEPVIIHWLGEMFDPALAGYWGSPDHMAAMETAVGIINAHAAKVDGVKISLLDKDKEIAMRRRLAKGVRMYTGDDFNYAELIAGDDKGYSDALLGIFDAIAPAASAALAALATGARARFDEILKPTVPLSRHIFKAPTRFYKTGVVFMAYLNGLQDHFVMVGGQQSARSLPHLAELFRLADRAGLLRDPDLARRRMGHVLALHGIA